MRNQWEGHNHRRQWNIHGGQEFGYISIMVSVVISQISPSIHMIHWTISKLPILLLIRRCSSNWFRSSQSVFVVHEVTVDYNFVVSTIYWPFQWVSTHLDHCHIVSFQILWRYYIESRSISVLRSNLILTLLSQSSMQALYPGSIPENYQPDRLILRYQSNTDAHINYLCGEYLCSISAIIGEIYRYLLSTVMSHSPLVDGIPRDHVMQRNALQYLKLTPKLGCSREPSTRIWVLCNSWIGSYPC